MKTLGRITFNPSVMGGKPCIRGLRITVGTIVGLLSAGKSEQEILENYPALEAADIGEALAYADPNHTGVTGNFPLSLA